MLHSTLIILLLLSSSFGDEGDDVKQGEKMKEMKVDERDVSDISGKVKVDGDDASRKVKVDERDEFSGKVILLYHPINTKSHRNQQNAIAEVCQRHNYHLLHLR